MSTRPTRLTTPLLSRVVGILALLALVVTAACSDDGGGDAGDATPTTPGGGEEDAADLDWEVSGEGTEAKTATRSGATPPATRPFIALLCRGSDTPAPAAITAETIQAMFTGSPRSLDGHVLEASYGALSLAGTVARGWFDLPKPTTQYADTIAARRELVNDCARAAQAGGVDMAPFSNVAVFLNDELTDAQATAVWPVTIPVAGQDRTFTSIILNHHGLNSPPLFLHELGHVLGGKHTSSPTDSLGGGAGYGDPLDAPWCCREKAIGPAWDASNRDAMGFVSADRKARYEGGTQQYTIARLTQPGPDGSLLVDVPIGTTTTRYVISARTRHGYDQEGFFVGVTFLGHLIPEPGVVIEKVSTDPEVDTTTVPSDPAAAGGVGGVWRSGQVFTDTANGVRISVDRFDETGAQVTVSSTNDPAPTTTAPAPTTTTTTAPVGTTVPGTPSTLPATPPAVDTTTTAPAAPNGAPTDDLASAPLLALPTDLAPFSTAGTGGAGEPMDCTGIGSTVWFKVVVPASGQVTVSTAGSDYDTMLGIYPGPETGATSSNLTHLGCIDDVAGSAQASDTITGPAGATLYLQVGGWRGATGNLKLSVR